MAVSVRCRIQISNHVKDGLKFLERKTINFKVFKQIMILSQDPGPNPHLLEIARSKYAEN